MPEIATTSLLRPGDILLTANTTWKHRMIEAGQGALMWAVGGTIAYNKGPSVQSTAHSDGFGKNGQALAADAQHCSVQALHERLAATTSTSAKKASSASPASATKSRGLLDCTNPKPFAKIRQGNTI